MSWTLYSEIEITDDVQSIHCDTRDFHISLSETKLEESLPSAPEYLFTEQEMKDLLKRLCEESGGLEKEWRFICFADENARVYGESWEFKYLRFYRVNSHFWVMEDRHDGVYIPKSFFDKVKVFGDLTELDKYRKSLGWESEESNYEYFPELQPHSVTYVRKEKKVHNNEPCPCESGLKYKKCCKNN